METENGKILTLVHHFLSTVLYNLNACERGCSGALEDVEDWEGPSSGGAERENCRNLIALTPSKMAFQCTGSCVTKTYTQLLILSLNFKTFSFKVFYCFIGGRGERYSASPDPLLTT